VYQLVALEQNAAASGQWTLTGGAGEAGLDAGQDLGLGIRLRVAHDATSSA
jgi:hypothetical protein